VFTNADNFKVEFKDADIRTKALFLATVFYIVSVLLKFLKNFEKCHCSFWLVTSYL